MSRCMQLTKADTDARRKRGGGPSRAARRDRALAGMFARHSLTGQSARSVVDSPGVAGCKGTLAQRSGGDCVF
jgi:hypothetical protein